MEIRDFAFDVTKWLGRKIKAEPDTVCDAKTREFFTKALNADNQVIAHKCKYIKCNNPCEFAKGLPNTNLI